MLGALSANAWSFNPFASQVVESVGFSGNGIYNDPNAVLGKPSTKFVDQFGTGQETRVKLVEPAYNVDIHGNKLITTINNNQSITVKFDHMVMDDPDNWYGLDFIVYGNAFFVGQGTVSDETDMNTYRLSGNGSIFAEPMKVSVSPDNVNWYTYENGPYADGLFPTQAYHWDVDNAEWTDREMDWTKPVNPALTSADFAGLTAAEAIGLYDGSAGGTGFDLAETGFAGIQYIRITGVSGFAGGEIDAFADVSPVPEPAALAVAALVALAARRRSKKS